MKTKRQVNEKEKIIANEFLKSFIKWLKSFRADSFDNKLLNKKNV